MINYKHVGGHASTAEQLDADRTGTECELDTSEEEEELCARTVPSSGYTALHVPPQM